MRRESLDFEWEFTPGKLSEIPGMGPPGRTVHLPHDFIIETDTYPEAPGGSKTGYYGGGVGTYTKLLDIPAELTGQRLLVEFDGAYMNATVSLNGHRVTKHHYGYTPFHADLTPYLSFGKQNRLSVTLNNAAQPNSRWYSGAGLYRHVDLLTAPQVHIVPWGIFARTSHIVDGTAFVVVETTVENHTSDAANVWVELDILKEADGSLNGTGRIKVHVPAAQKGVCRTTVAVDQADLWDIDSPNLYLVTARLTDGAAVLDTATTTFGIRTISLDAKYGFRLNGRSIKLKGGCVHHDNGILGSASYKDSEFRKMKLHKDNGYNAIRCAHNPPSRDMLDACDRIGLLVINEAFDVWTMAKDTHDYSLYFEQNWKSDLESFMLRDRNHPSIIMWATGNEVPERGGLSDGYRWADILAKRVRELDPTRFVTNALCSFFNGLDDADSAVFYGELFSQTRKAGSVTNLDTEFGKRVWPEYTEAFAAPLDAVGYNYLNYHYKDAASRFPGRVVYGSESKPLEMDQYWADVERYPHVIGDFNWTSYDYIGEAGLGKSEYVDSDEAEAAFRRSHQSPYPWRTAHDADFDLCGYARPQLAYRRIVWGSQETYIVSRPPLNYGKVEVLGRWGWPECEHSWTWEGFEGRMTQVQVYSSSEEVELYLNGRSLGRRPSGQANRFIASFELPYEQGKLEAISYTNGFQVSSDSLETAGEPVGVRIIPERETELLADGQSLLYAIVEIVDSNGKIVPTVELQATARIEGAATLAAFGTGNPRTEENYTKGVFTSFKGRLQTIIRAGYKPGAAKLTVEVQGLPAAALDIYVGGSIPAESVEC